MPSSITVNRPPGAPVVLAPDRPTRREPLYSQEFVDRLHERHIAEREHWLNKYCHRMVLAHHAIRMALLALEHGDVDRAVRELRRGGALSTEELQET